MNQNEIEKVMDKATQKNEPVSFRFGIALLIIVPGFIVIIGLALAGILGKLKPAKELLDILLPVIAAWTGAVVAYYFSQQCVDSANKTVNQLVEKLSPEQRLASTPVVDSMISRNKMGVYQMEKNDNLEQITLLGEKTDKKSIRNKMNEVNQNRLPVIDIQNRIQLIIHRSMVDRFLVKRYSEDPNSSLKKLILKDVPHDDVIRKTINEGMAFVKPSATMAEAKREMEQTKDCLDVFVTVNGKPDGEVIGWITNNKITKCAQA